MLTEYKERRFNRVEIAASLGSLEKPCGVERRYHFFGLFDDITSVHLLFSFVNSFSIVLSWRLECLTTCVRHVRIFIHRTSETARLEELV